MDHQPQKLCRWLWAMTDSQINLLHGVVAEENKRRECYVYHLELLKERWVTNEINICLFSFWVE